MQPMPPYSAPAHWWWIGVSGLLPCWQLQLGTCSVGCLFVCFFLPVMLPSEIPKLPQRPSCERVSYCLVTSPPSWLPLQDGSPNLTLLSLLLSFIFCPNYFGIEWAAFLGAWCPPPAFRSCSAFKWSFDEFVGEKVVSPFYSSAILGPPPELLIFVNSL